MGDNRTRGTWWRTALVLGTVLLILTPATAFAPPSTPYVSRSAVYPYTSGPNTQWMVDGEIYNGDTVDGYTDVRVTMRWRDASNVQLGAAITFPADCREIANTSGENAAFFSWPVGTPPAGWTHVDFSVSGKPTVTPRITIGLTPQSEWTTDPDGFRRRTFTVTNNQTFPITGLLFFGYETEGVDAGNGAFKDANAYFNQLSVVLQPGQTSAEFEIVFRNPPDSDGTTDIFHYQDCDAVRSNPVSVHRFYNLRTGTHFYTADPTEVNRVIATLGWLYRYEGVAYTVNQGSPSNSNPLYRFYDLRTGTHFYTADAAEANNIIATMGSTFHFDGPAYNVSPSPDYSQQVWRFYNYVTGTHFYTADPAERANVQANLYHLYQYEGPAFSLAY
jgi:hypothetical protein